MLEDLESEYNFKNSYKLTIISFEERREQMEKLTRKEFLQRSAGILGALVLGPSLGEGATEKQTGNPPNILLITTDQERHPDTLPDVIRYPNRERLRQESLNFKNYYVQTSPCGPSRSVIYTGQPVQNTGIFSNPDLDSPLPNPELPRKLPTLGSMLRDAGYYTAYKGKWHLTNFQEKGRSSTDELENFGFSDYQEYGDTTGAVAGGHNCGQIYDPIIAKDTEEWLRQRRDTAASDPWFLAVNLVNPHDIMFHDTGGNQNATRVNPDYWGKIEKTGAGEIYQQQWPVDLPRSFYVDQGRETKPFAHENWFKNYSYVMGDIPLENTDQWKEFQNFYINCIMDNDRHLGTILDALEKNGFSDNTIIMFTSDHGELAGAHGLRSKGPCVYREVMNVPFSIKVPGLTKGEETKALGSATDIAPTILSLAGTGKEEIKRQYPALRGYDLSPVINSPADQGPRDKDIGASLLMWTTLSAVDSDYAKKIITASGKGPLEMAKSYFQPPYSPNIGLKTFYRGMFDGRYKFARYFSPIHHHTPENFETLMAYNEIEIYDTLSDPDEVNNLASDVKKNRELIMHLNMKLNTLVHREIGEDDGRFLPGLNNIWRL